MLRSYSIANAGAGGCGVLSEILRGQAGAQRPEERLEPKNFGVLHSQRERGHRSMTFHTRPPGRITCDNTVVFVYLDPVCEGDGGLCVCVPPPPPAVSLADHLAHLLVQAPGEP